MLGQARGECGMELFGQLSLELGDVMLRQSDFVLDLATTCCFFEHHEISEFSM